MTTTLGTTAKRLGWILLAAVACSGCSSSGHTSKPEGKKTEARMSKDGGMDFVGTATMEKDGTLVLRLSSYDERVGGRAEGVLRYPPAHHQYQSILDHVGEIKPGQTKAIKPWD